jgi:hypothetical protein
MHSCLSPNYCRYVYLFIVVTSRVYKPRMYCLSSKLNNENITVSYYLFLLSYSSIEPLSALYLCNFLVLAYSFSPWESILCWSIPRIRWIPSLLLPPAGSRCTQLSDSTNATGTKPSPPLILDEMPIKSATRCYYLINQGRIEKSIRH